MNDDEKQHMSVICTYRTGKIIIGLYFFSSCGLLLYSFLPHKFSVTFPNVYGTPINTKTIIHNNRYILIGR